jgi:hypothetical protein
MDVDLRARINEMVKTGASAREPQDRAPDSPRYSFITMYPYGTLKSSDMYLWLDRLYKISRIKSVRAGMHGAPLAPAARKAAQQAAGQPAAAPARAAARIEEPQAPAALAEAPTTRGAAYMAAAARKRKAEKAIGAGKAGPAPEKAETEIKVAKEAAAPAKPAEPEEMEFEAGPAAAAAPAKKGAEKEAEEERETEIETKGDIGEINMSEEDMKKSDEDESAKPAEKRVERTPSGKVRISYLDEHAEPKISEPEMLSWDMVEKAEEDISSISEGVRSSVYQDRIDITKRLLELTKMKITEKDLNNKKKIDSEIMLLRDRMKGEKVKTADLPSLVRSHLSSETESAANELADSLDGTSNELRSKYENAKKIAEGDSALLSRIEIQFVDDSNIVGEGYSKVLASAIKFLTEFHCRKVDIALSKDIFDKKEAESLKDSITKGYPDRFGAVRKKIEAIRQKKQELIASSDVLSAVVSEISGMKEAELLHELGARDRKAFLLYIKGEMDKSTAIAHARRGIAKERGLPDELVDRYFPKGEET